jgi:hypothetical protein
VERIQELYRQDRRRTIHDIDGYGACQLVLTKEIGMQIVANKFLPTILTDDRKQQRVDVCHFVFLAKHTLPAIPHQPDSLICKHVTFSYTQK